MEKIKYSIPEILTAIMDLIDKDRYIPDCGGDIDMEECQACKYFHECKQGYDDAKMAKHCRGMIRRIKDDTPNKAL